MSEATLAVPCARCGEMIEVPVTEMAAGAPRVVQHTVCPRDIDVTPRLTRYRMEIRIFKGDDPEPLVGTGAEAETATLREALDALAPRLANNWSRMVDNAWMAET